MTPYQGTERAPVGQRWNYARLGIIVDDDDDSLPRNGTGAGGAFQVRWVR